MLVTAAAVAGFTAPGQAQTMLRAVMHSDLKILDPIWTTAYIVRNHGYMIYDTLFATDAKGEVKPQMVGKHEVSADQLTHTLTLRDGLVWHDGTPVTSEDCVASIKRWGAKDATGQKLMSFVTGFEIKDAKTFVIKLKEPTGLVLLGLGKPSSAVPFMMPKRVAETDPNTQISEFIGSGPFVFKKDEWKPGDKTVYVKFAQYKPRNEPLRAGGRIIQVDHKSSVALGDSRPPTHSGRSEDRLYGVAVPTSSGAQEGPNVNAGGHPTRWATSYAFRYNTLQALRQLQGQQAVMVAFNQKDFSTVIGTPRTTSSARRSSHAVAERVGQGAWRFSTRERQKAKRALKGRATTARSSSTSTDSGPAENCALVPEPHGEGGFKVDMQPWTGRRWWPAARRRTRLRRAAGTRS
jgi:peptide/nickel transport system substrate-binding protein